MSLFVLAANANLVSVFKVVLELTKKAATEAAPALVLSICILAVGAVVPIPTLPDVFKTTTLGVVKLSLTSSKAKYVD